MAISRFNIFLFVIYLQQWLKKKKKNTNSLFELLGGKIATSTHAVMLCPH